jgi:hypothetical protein
MNVDISRMGCVIGNGFSRFFFKHSARRRGRVRCGYFHGDETLVRRSRQVERTVQLGDMISLNVTGGVSALIYIFDVSRTMWLGWWWISRVVRESHAFKFFPVSSSFLE